MSYTSQKNCEIASTILSVDNVMHNTYDLIISLSTDSNCEVICKIIGNSQNGLNLDKYEFDQMHYYFFKFVSLVQFKEQEYVCQSKDNNITKSMKSSKYIFPKSSLETKLIAFGDWSKCNDGEKTYFSHKITVSI